MTNTIPNTGAAGTETGEPAIIVTDLAAEKLAEVLAEEGQPEGMLRVIVVPNGHGAQYMLSLEDTLAEDDLVLYESGIRVIADEDSAPLLQGASIDYSEGLMRSGFVIENPNIATAGGCGNEGCGCGSGGCGCGSGGCGGH
ncbi:MAG: iron-sulfur cluster assembly accessory protein [Chloroflexi bacterium]|nr:iron-sulfur cluster assembly accessory protein [Chloroflexota bacterium]